jgi:glycosyltransferase involved in cell wall biosynthesis
MIAGKKIAAVVVAYNAENTLEFTVNAIPKGVVDILIITDDFSTDKTAEIAKKLNAIVLTHKKNRGYGAAQKTGYREALNRGADVVVMLHGDFQYDPTLLPSLARPLAEGRADVCFGSRMQSKKNAWKSGMPWWRFVANVSLSKLEEAIFGLGLSEYHTGYRAYTRRFLLNVPFEKNSDDFVFDTEIFAEASRGKFRATEVPIPTRYLPGNQSINFKRSVTYGIQTLGVLAKHLLRKILRSTHATQGEKKNMPVFSFFESTKKSFLFLLILTLAVFIASGVALSNKKLNGYDEGYYGKYIKILNEEGVAGIRNIIQTFPSEKVNEAPPTPLRILFISASATTCHVLAVCGVENAGIISLLSGIALVFVSFFLFRKLFTSEVALLSASLVAMSPLVLALSARALQDTFFTLIVIGCVLLYHLCWTRKKIIDPILFGILLFAGFLTKETMVFFYPCFLIIGVQYYQQKTEHASLKNIALALSIAPLIYFITISWVAGGMWAFIDYYLLWSKRVMNVPYVLHYQQGAWFRYLVDFTLLSPLTFFLAIIGITIPLPDKKNNTGRKIAVLYFFSILAIFSSFSAVYNLRMIIFLDVFVRALAVLGVVGIISKIQKKFYRYFVGMLLFLCLALVEFSQFSQLFVISNIYDPVTKDLISANGFIK